MSITLRVTLLVSPSPELCFRQELINAELWTFFIVYGDLVRSNVLCLAIITVVGNHALQPN